MFIWPCFQTVIETSLSIPTGSLTMDSMVTRYDPYLLMVARSDAGNFAESMATLLEGAEDGPRTDTLELVHEGIVYRANVSSKVGNIIQRCYFLKFKLIYVLT